MTREVRRFHLYDAHGRPHVAIVSQDFHEVTSLYGGRFERAGCLSLKLADGRRVKELGEGRFETYDDGEPFTIAPPETPMHPTPTIRGLHAAVLSHPYDDAARLIYADCLEETGDPANVEAAHFIRDQIRGENLERQVAAAPRVAMAGLPAAFGAAGFFGAGKLSCGVECGGVTLPAHVTMTRGFVSEVAVGLNGLDPHLAQVAALAKVVGDVFSTQPLETVRLYRLLARAEYRDYSISCRPAPRFEGDADQAWTLSGGGTSRTFTGPPQVREQVGNMLAELIRRRVPELFAWPTPDADQFQRLMMGTWPPDAR